MTKISWLILRAISSTLLVISITFLSRCAFGQKKQVQFGISSSFGWQSYAFAEKSDLLELRGRLSYSGGVIVSVPITDVMFVRSGINYTSKSYMQFFPAQIYYPDSDPTIGKYPIKDVYKSNYLEIPIDFRFGPPSTRKFAHYPLVGLAAAFRVSKKRESNEGDSGVYDPDPFFYSSFLISAKAGWGFQFALNATVLQIEPQLQYCINRMYESYEAQKPIYFGIGIGLIKN